MKLAVFDVEGTIFHTKVRLPGTSIDSTIWQAIANALGSEAEREEIETHRRWKNKEYRTYLEWVKDTIRIHQKYGIRKELFDKLITSAEYNDGVATVFSSIDRTKFEPILISGGFRELASRAQKDFDIYHAFGACEYIFGTDGFLKSYNLLPCDFEGKIDFIRLMLREYSLQDDDWIFVGDGANDSHIARVAPFSIGFRPHPELRKVVKCSIENFDQLTNVLQAC